MIKFWMYGIFCAAVAGAFWTVLWQVIITMSFIISTGTGLSLEVGPAAITGLGGGLFAIYYRSPNAVFRNIAGCIVIFILLCGSSSMNLFDIDKQFLNYKNLSTFLIIGTFSWFTIAATISDLKPQIQKRYIIEKFYLRLLWGLGLIIFILVVVVPFYIMILTSLKSQQSLLSNPLDLSIDFEAGMRELLRSYIELFTDYSFGTLLLNSAIVSIVTVLITLFFSIPGAYAVAKLKFPGRKWLSSSVLLIYLIPAIILVIPLYAVFSQLGLRNSLVGLCIVYPATTIPVALYMLRGYFAGLPSELDDAGLMDGLSRLQIILKIAIPLSMPAISSVALYVFMIAWNEFLFAFMFLDDIKLFTLSRGIVSLNSSEVPRQHLMAGAVIATAPVLFLFLWFERFLVSGLTTGSVKG